MLLPEGPHELLLGLGDLLGVGEVVGGGGRGRCKLEGTIGPGHGGHRAVALEAVGGVSLAQPEGHHTRYYNCLGIRSERPKLKQSNPRFVLHLGVPSLR